MKGTHFKDPAPGGSIARKIVNPDLQEERDRCNFDQDELEDFLNATGVRAYTEKLDEDFKNNPEIRASFEYYELTREEQMKRQWEQASKRMELNPNRYFYEVDKEGGMCTPWGYSQGVDPLTLHYNMFMHCVKLLGSEEQNKLWMDDIRHLRMMGCYAQTELGHGSNVSSLETTATLDMKTDEFVIHSPTVTSTKYWPGGLGRSGNHAIVFARCIVDGNDFGVQPFMVRIRDSENHLPVKGIQVGDIGPKLGYNTKDNGWLIFNEVRIPRTNMLSKFAYVDEEGAFEIRGNPKVLYQTMVEIRFQIVSFAGLLLRRVLIIGIRYAVCRRQFQTIQGSRQERKIMDYQSHIVKMAPVVAQSFIMQVVGTSLNDLMKQMVVEVQGGKHTTLDMMHHFTSGLKSLYSNMTYEGIDFVRVNCGGAGYSVWSGLPEHYFWYSPVPVYEGDNTVMAQQTVSYIQKCFKNIRKGKGLHPYFNYFTQIEELCGLKSTAKTEEDFYELEHIDNALAIRAAWVVRDVLRKLEDKKVPYKTLINDLYATDLLRMSKNHHQYMSFVIFRNAIERQYFKDANIKPLLILVAKLFALHILQQDSVLLYESGFFGAGSNELLQQVLKKACLKMRPQIINLVELKSNEFMDQSYVSAIGNKYGDIYEKQLELAMGSRLNKTPKPEYWDTLIKPMMNKAKL